MIVVADTAPINYLAQLDLVHLVYKVYGTLLLPPEVATEWLPTSTPEAVRLWAANLPTWVRIQAPMSPQLGLLQSLDAGERAAITLSLEVSASAVLIDERKRAT